MLMIFEDRETMPISLMFKKIYGDAADFSSGAKNLAATIEKHKDEDKIFCFVDVVAGNVNTLKSFITLLDDYYDNDRVDVIPIPCIEYYALLTINSLGYFDESYIDLLLYIKNGSDYKESIDGSFEKYCKDKLNHLANKCMHNNKSQKKEYGYWYSNDCDCSYRDTCIKFKYEQKLVSMLEFMPMFIATKAVQDLITIYKGNMLKYDDKTKERFAIYYKRMLEILYNT